MKQAACWVSPCPIYTEYAALLRLTCEADAGRIEAADSLDALVQNNCEGRRLKAGKARRWQRRYKNRFANELLRISYCVEV